jgi:hypothetical protein
MSHHPLQSTVCFLSLLLTLTGCTEQVVGGVEPDGGAASDPAATAFAMLGSSLPTGAAADDYLSVQQITVQPDTLYVFIGNGGQTCASPFLSESDNLPYSVWQEALGIPSALQDVGALSLTAAGVDNSLHVLAACGGDSETCTGSYAAPGLSGGSVAITSFDATQVTLQLTGVEPVGTIQGAPPSEITAEYQALRCP